MLRSAFQAFGLFSRHDDHVPASFYTYRAFSGIGVHYAPSTIVTTDHQDLATNLRIGERVVPQVILRAADARPENIQELVKSDFRFKLLIFAGDISVTERREALVVFASQVESPNSFVKRFTPPSASADSVFDIFTIWLAVLFSPFLTRRSD